MQSKNYVSRCSYNLINNNLKLEKQSFPQIKNSVKGSRAICILGMHRSGTSVITRVLNLLGIYLGDDDSLIPPAPDNPKGFWENAKFVNFHARLLDAIGFGYDRWDVPLPLPNNWWKSPNMEIFKSQLAEIVVRDFSSHKLWGWKDPRTCLFVPLWIEVLNFLNIEINYVITVRNPIEVAESLNSRNGFSISKGLVLWWLYVLNALYWTQGFKRIFVFYENFMSNWKNEIIRVAKELCLDWPNDEDSFVQQVNAFIEPELRHFSRVKEETFLQMPPPIEQLYKFLLDGEEMDKKLDCYSLKELYCSYETLTNLNYSEVIKSEYNLKDIQIVELRRWATELEQGKNWLEEQCLRWQNNSRKKDEKISELEKWINELENSKDWLNNQLKKCQDNAKKKENIMPNC